MAETRPTVSVSCWTRWGRVGKGELGDYNSDLHREFTSFAHPRVAEGEREIIAYLLENRQKMFEVRPDGEETATLLAKGFVVHEVRTLAVSS